MKRPPPLVAACAVGLGLFTLAHAAFADDVFSHPSSARALADTILADTARTLSQAKTLRGHFTHRKYLSEVPAPLVATGEFVFARDLGIDWHTETPFDSEFVLTQAGMLQRDEGSDSIRLSAAEQPTVRAAAEIFLALFTLDLDTLARNFDIFGYNAGPGWVLGLRPKTAALRTVLSQVVVRGAHQVDTIELRDAGGDRTEIMLRDVQVSAAEPTADERRRFEP